MALPNPIDLQYILPKDVDSQVDSLARILRIPPNYINLKSEQLVRVLCGVILYRHLDRFEKREVMESVYKITNERLVSKLIERVVDPIIRPEFGIWSLTNEELLDRLNFHK